jgi:hypothetical protein
MAKPIERSTDGLRAALFEELDALRSGKTTAQKSSALARLAATIVSTSKLDIDYQRFAKGLSDDKLPASPTVPPLSLGKKTA